MAACAQGETSVQSGWTLGEYFWATGMVGSEATTSLTLAVWGWNNEPVLDATYTVAPGYLSSTLFESAAPAYRDATLGNSNGLVSLAVKVTDSTITAAQTAVNQFCYSGSNWDLDNGGEISLSANGAPYTTMFFPENPETNGGAFSYCWLMPCAGGEDTPMTITAVGSETGTTASYSFTMSGCLL